MKKLAYAFFLVTFLQQTTLATEPYEGSYSGGVIISDEDSTTLVDDYIEIHGNNVFGLQQKSDLDDPNFNILGTFEWSATITEVVGGFVYFEGSGTASGISGGGVFPVDGVIQEEQDGYGPYYVGWSYSADPLFLEGGAWWEAPPEGPDLWAWGLEWNVATGDLDCYFLSDYFSETDIKGGLFWADGTNYTDIISSTPVYSFDVTPFDNPFSFEPSEIHVPEELLLASPPGATHVLLFFDYDDLLDESDEENNVAAVQILAPTISSPSFDSAHLDILYEYQIVANRDPTSYGAVGLPAGLSVNTSSGLISGIPTELGIFNITLSAINGFGVGTLQFQLTVSMPIPVITSPSIKTGYLNQTFGYLIVANHLPTSYGASGLPAGLSVNTSSGLISGIPTELGIFYVNLLAINSSGTGALTLHLTILQPGQRQPEVVAWGNNTFGQANVPNGLVDVIDIDAGKSFNLALISDGTLEGWGSNTYGQLTFPLDLTNVVQAACGNDHALALKVDGTVIGWGNNSHGKATIPVNLTNIAAIAAGANHNLVLKSNGTVAGWGSDAYGQSSSPSYVGNAVAVAAGTYHSLALGVDGRVMAWGGDDYWKQAVVPESLSNVVAVAAGRYHSLALKSDGTIVGWGSNYNGALNIPVGLSNVVEIAALDYLSLALKKDGSIASWGGSNPQPPTGSGYLSVEPGESHGLALSAFTDPVAFPEIINRGFVMGAEGYPLSFGIKAKNNPFSFNVTGLPPGMAVDPVTGWISGVPSASGTYPINLMATNGHGLSEQMISLFINKPRPIITVGAFKPVHIGNPVEIALSFNYTDSYFVSGLPTGLVYSNETHTISGTPLGSGVYNVNLSATNQYGVVTNSIRLKVLDISPVVAWGENNYGRIEVPFRLSNVKEVSISYKYGLALKEDGTVVAWGVNSYTPSGLSNVTSVAAGPFHNIALKSDSTVVAWGSSSSTPPNGLSNVVSVSVGYHTLALKEDGTVVSWGSNSYGETNVPVGFSNVVSISAGSHCSFALKSDGTVIGWGQDSSGQVSGASGLSNIVAIAAGGSHGMALKSDGTVVGWGNNYWGQLNIPADVTNIVDIAAGGEVTMALTADGDIKVWGNDDYGQLDVPVGLGKVIDISVGSSSCVVLVEEDGISAHTLESWASSYGLSGGSATPNSNTDGDESDLLSEYAFNLNPTSNDTLRLTPGAGTFGLPYIALDGTGSNVYLRVEYIRRKNAADLTYAVQFNSDLRGAWESAANPEVVTPIDADWERVVVEDIMTVAAAPVRFGRVMVMLDDGSLSGIATWIASYGLTGSSAELGANNDGDSSTILEEYAYNLNPTANDTVKLIAGTGTYGIPLITVTGSSGSKHLLVEYIRRKGDPNLVYTAQFSNNLTGAWNNSTGTESVTSIDTTWERVVVQDTVTSATEDARFSRVVVSYSNP